MTPFEHNGKSSLDTRASTLKVKDSCALPCVHKQHCSKAHILSYSTLGLTPDDHLTSQCVIMRITRQIDDPLKMSLIFAQFQLQGCNYSQLKSAPSFKGRNRGNWSLVTVTFQLCDLKVYVLNVSPFEHYYSYASKLSHWQPQSDNEAIKLPNNKSLLAWAIVRKRALYRTNHHAEIYPPKPALASS